MIENKRKFPRFQFQEPVEYQRSFSSFRGGVAGNLSLGGIKLMVHEFIALGTVLEMMVHFDHPPRQILAKGKVMWVREYPGGERYEIGVEFLRDAQPVEEIGQYLNTRRFEPI